MRTGNPALNGKTFVSVAVSGDEMTLDGTVNKTAVLLALTVLTAAWTWSLYFQNNDPAAVMPYLWTGLIGGLIIALFTIFRKTAAPYTAPLYAAFEGLALGGISAFYEAAFPGIVIQAIALTFGTMFCLLAAYRSGLIRATENFKLGVTAATGAIALLYLVNLGMGFFGKSMPFIHESGFLGIGFSLFVVGIAAMNLVLDFDFIETGVEQRAPKYMEWYAAFGLMVTLIWLYLEILRLLSKIRD